MNAHVAHHFDTSEQQKEAGLLGMWLFLTTEILFFAGMFLGFSIYRGMYPVAFAAASSQLDVTLGTINTAVLLCSSLTVALAVHAAQSNDSKGITRFLIVTIILGAIFLVIKGFEYSDKYHHHHIPGSNFVWDEHQEGAHDTEPKHSESEIPDHYASSEADAATAINPGNAELFYCFYFAMTGMHALHMVIGMVILGIIAYFASRGVYSAESHMPVEFMGLYWHFVDIVWVFLFPLLYLIG